MACFSTDIKVINLNVWALADKTVKQMLMFGNLNIYAELNAKSAL